MNIELYFTSAGLSENDLRGKTVVVVDVLRACTVIPTAFSAGCKEIIPVRSIGDSSTLLGNLDRDVVVLAGEREGQKIEGFDLGNSPFEFTEGVVGGKTIILASTNGSKVLVLGSSAESCIAASFVNVGVVAEEISRIGSDVAIICSGKEHRFSLEDALCGGMLISRIGAGADASNDAAAVALTLHDQHSGDLAGALKSCDHGRYLKSIGFGGDIEYAAKVDSVPILPIMRQGRLVNGRES